MNDTDVGVLQGAECKSTVARWPAGRSVVHAGITGPEAGLSLSANIHLSVLNNSYDHMCL